MPIYRPKSINSLLASFTVVTLLTIAGATITGDLIPTSDATHSVGSSSYRWKDLTISGTGTSNLAWVVTATNTRALAVQDGNGNNFLTADTSNRLLRVVGSQTPTSNLFEVSNKDNSRKYLTVSSTSTTIANGSAAVFNVGQTTDNGSGIVLNGDNSYITSNSNKALVLMAPGSANLMYFQVNSVNRFVINGSGNAAFGHTSPNSRFSISERSSTQNLFEINNANTSGVYTKKYFTISSTSTALNGCTGSVSANAVTCSGTIGTITDSTDVNLSSSRAAITLTNTAIQTTSVITANVCSTPDAGAGFTVAVTPGAGTATVSVRNVGLSNQTSDYKFCFHVFNPL